MKVNRNEHRIEKPSVATRPLPGTLCAFLGVGGTGARTYRLVCLGRLILASLAATVALAVLAPVPSFAAFTRPFLRQLTGTTSGHFKEPRGVAVDAEGNLWVSERLGKNEVQPPSTLDEFDSAELGNAFVKALEINGLESMVTLPEALAINRSTGAFYVTGGSSTNPLTRETGLPFVEAFENTGAFLKQWGPIGGSSVNVAVDNSCSSHKPVLTELTMPSCKEFDPSNGSVYVAHNSPNPPSPSGDGSPAGIEKFDASLKPINFSGSASYIFANRITGPPGRFESELQAEGIAVDSHGNIFVVNQNEGENEVREYSLSGLFIRSFNGEETPGLAGSHEQNGFGGFVLGVAVDPVSDDLLVGVDNSGRVGAAIDEFDSSGHFLNQMTETSEGHVLHSTFALAPDSHGDIYVVNSGGVSELTDERSVDVYGPGHFLPTLKLAEATERTPESALLSGSVDPEGRSLTECVFQYVAEAAFQKTGFSDLSSGGQVACMPAAGSIPPDSSVHQVEAKIAGLASGGTYRFRLVATSSGALGGEGQSAVFAFTAPHAPAIDSTAAFNLSSTFADLNAQIRPLGADTTYRFQYVEAAHYKPTAEDPYAAGSSVPVPAADIGSGASTGGADSTVLQHIGGLSPATGYHFRVIASNEMGATAGPDTTFTTLAEVSPGLPDHRAYELVTPPNKGSASDMFATAEQGNEFINRDTGYPSLSGDQFLLETRAAFGPFPASFGNAYVFSRTPSGWTYTALASPSLGLQSVAVAAFDPLDFSQIAITDSIGSGASPTGTSALSLIGPPGGGTMGELYTTLHADAGEHPPASPTEVTRLVGASHDLTHSVLESSNHTLDHLAEGQVEGSRALYEYSSGELNLLNVTSAGELLSPCGAVLGQGGGTDNAGNTDNAVSADGTRVLFTAPDPYANAKGTGCWDHATSNAPQVYLRSAGATTQISAPEAGVVDPTGRHAAVYVGASEDGSRVFFLTQSELTKDDEGIHDLELYEWRAEGTGGCAGANGCLTRVSSGESGHATADVFTVPAVSADGSAVYFTAFGQLTADAPAPGSVNGEQGLDLYRYDTETGATAYIATVGPNDYPTGTVAGWWPPAGIPQVVGLDNNANWNTTPNGRYLLFATAAELTGYSTAEPPTAPPCETPGSQGPHNGHCTEVYRYDSATRSIACVSCNPSGAPPLSNAEFALRSASQGADAGPIRAISNDGSMVFFDTADALVPQDGNGTVDVYEWHEGKLSLISSGQDSSPSFFLGSSPDGANVFFGTHARLVPQDTDTAGDVYDARVCTESDPCIKPPPGETAQCEGDACQNPPPAPIDATPGSLTFSGAGNILLQALPPTKTVTPKKTIRCSKGKKLSHGKCVRTKRKKTKAKKAGNNRRVK